MNLKFFSAKTAATLGVPVSKFALVVSAFRQITALIEVNGAEKLLINYLMKIHSDDINEIQKRIGHLLVDEKPLTDQLVSEDQKLIMRAADRCREVIRVLKSLTGYDFNGKVAPKLTSDEKDARIHFLMTQLKISKRDQTKFLSELETTKITNVKLKRAVIQLKKNLEDLNLKLSAGVESSEELAPQIIPQISIEELIKNREELTNKLQAQQLELSQNMLKLTSLENKIVSLETQIRSVDEKIAEIKSENENLEIEKKDLEGLQKSQQSVERNRRIDAIVNQLKSNQKKLGFLEKELNTKESQIETFRKQDQLLREQIAALELKIIRYHEKDLFLPWFAFLRKYFILTPALQYQMAKYLVNEIKGKEIKILWKNNLFELLNKLDQPDHRAQVIKEWFQKNIPQLPYQIDSHQNLIRLSLENEKLSPVIEKYFKDLPHQTFSLSHHTVFYLLSSFVISEMEHVDDVLLRETATRVLDTGLFWNECWQIGYKETDPKNKLEQLQTLWQKYGFQHTQIELFDENRLVLTYKMETPQKIRLELEAQNAKKQNLNAEGIHFLKSNAEYLKNSLGSFRQKYPDWPILGLSAGLTGIYFFGYLSRVLFNILPLGVDLWMTYAVSACAYLYVNFLVSQKINLWPITIKQTFKNLKLMRTQNKKNRLLAEALALSQTSWADFEMQMWNRFLNSYDEGSELVKKIAYEWLPNKKKKIRLTAKIANNELDHFVKHVILGKVNLETNDEFSQNDFNQIRKLLVTELIDQYLKNELHEQVIKILDRVPQTGAEKNLFKKEFGYLLNKRKQNPQAAYFDSPLYEKPISQEALRWLSIYKQYEKF